MSSPAAAAPRSAAGPRPACESRARADASQRPRFAAEVAQPQAHPRRFAALGLCAWLAVMDTLACFRLAERRAGHPLPRLPPAAVLSCRLPSSISSGSVSLSGSLVLTEAGSATVVAPVGAFGKVGGDGVGGTAVASHAANRSAGSQWRRPPASPVATCSASGAERLPTSANSAIVDSKAVAPSPRGVLAKARSGLRNSRRVGGSA